MRRAIVLYAVLGTVATVGHGQEPVSPARDTGPDPTGSLPDAAYARLAALVQRLEDDPGGQGLRSYCAMHGAEAALNALYLGRRLGNAEQVERVLGDRLPPEASLLSRFDAAERPDPRDLEFTLVRAPMACDSPFGWLVRYVPGGVEVLAQDMSIVRCSPAAVTRPPSPDPFRRYCVEFFSAKLVDPEAERSWLTWHNAVNTNAFQSCVLADWSFRRGDIGNALKLWEHARAIVAHRFGRGPLDGETFEHFIGEELATALEQQAVLAAAAGESRTELRERWRTIVRVRADKAAVERIPPAIPVVDYFSTPTAFSRSGWHDARDMVRFYDQLLAEDEAWHEPAPEELTAQDAAALARYWMHKLRESHAGRHAMGSHEPSVVLWGRGDDPARRLFALGAAAIPVLIEHYEDPTPTRGYRSFHLRGIGGSSYTPWRHGDVCIELLNLITGRVFRNRAAAAAWWETARWTDPPAHCLQQLRSRDREAREKAALWLITLGDRVYVDAVIARVLDGDPARNAMLAFLRGNIEEQAAARLVPLLACDDHYTAVAVAWALQGTSRARDAREAVLRRTLVEASQGAVRRTDMMITSSDRARSGFWWLAATQDNHLRAAFARALSATGRETADVVLESAHLFACREVLDVLLRILREDGRAVVPIRRMLIDMWGVADEEREGWSEEEVRRWLLENRIDWEARQRDVRARMAWDTEFYPWWFRW